MSFLHNSRACLVVPAAYCVLAAGHASAQRYTGPNFTLTQPIGWTVTTNNVAKGGVAFVGPKEQGFSVNINLLSEPAPRETLAQYVKAAHGQLATHKEMKMIKEGSAILGGGPAHTLSSEVQLADHPNLPVLRAYQVYTMHKDRAYILTLTYPKSTTETSVKKYTASMDKLVASFQWTK